MNNKDTESYFSKIATSKGLNEENNVDKFDVIYQKMLPNTGRDSLLECGGGGGFYTHRFLSLGYQVTSVDLSEDALAINMEKAKELGLQEQLTTLTGEFSVIANGLEGKFKQVVFIKVLHHFDQMSSIYSALKCGINKTQKNGKVIIFEPNGSNPLWRIFLSFKKSNDGVNSVWHYEQNMKYTKVKLLKKFLEQQNIVYKVSYHYVIPAFLLNKGNLFSKSLRKLNALLEKSIFKYCAFNFSIEIYV